MGRVARPQSPMKPIHLLGTALLLSPLASAQMPPEALEAMTASKIVILVRNDVAEEIALTPDQKDRIKARIALPGGERRSMPGGMMRGLMIDMMKQKIREMEAGCLSELSRAQQARLNEIHWQWRGATSLYDRSIRRQLKLTRDQDRAIGDIRKAFEERSRAGSPSDRPGIPEEHSRLWAVLSPDQKGQLSRLGGAAMTFSNSAGAYASLPSGPGR